MGARYVSDSWGGTAQPADEKHFNHPGYPYLPGRSAGLNDVTAGSNGDCEAARAYLCHAVAGYDGPTGLGTPDGVSAFTAPAGRVITVISPGNRDASAGQRLRLTVHAVDSAAGQRLTYSATGLPRGLAVSAGTGQVSGTLPARGGIYHVTVTAADSSGARGSATFRIVAVPSLRAAYRKVAGPVRLTLDPGHVRCLTVAGGTIRAGARAGLWPCDGRAAQQWAYTPDASPDGAGRLIIGGMCLTIGGNGVSNGARTELDRCDGATRQQWSLQAGPVSLLNPATRRCLDDPAGRSGRATPDGTPVDVFDCTFLPGQAFTLPAGPVLSAIAGMCVTGPGNKAAAGTPVTLAKCGGGSAQKWDIFSSPDGFPAAHGGQCWIAAPVRENDGTYAFLDGTPVRLGPCDSPVSGAPGAPPADFGTWLPLPDGEIQSGDSGRCLADPGNAATPGKALVLNDCYGDPGEIWAVA
jgi:hypothetical protein